MKNDLLILRFEPAPDWDGMIPFTAAARVAAALEDLFNWVAAPIGPGTEGEEPPVQLYLAASPSAGSIEFRFDVRVRGNLSFARLRSQAGSVGGGFDRAVQNLANLVTLGVGLPNLVAGGFGLIAYATGAANNGRPVEPHDIDAAAIASRVHGAGEPVQRVTSAAQASGCSSVTVHVPNSEPVQLVTNPRRNTQLLGRAEGIGAQDVRGIELPPYFRSDVTQIRIEVGGKSTVAFVGHRQRESHLDPELDRYSHLPNTIVFVWSSKRSIPEPSSSGSFPFAVRGQFLAPSQINLQDDLPFGWEKLPVFMVGSSISWE